MGLSFFSQCALCQKLKWCSSLQNFDRHSRMNIDFGWVVKAICYTEGFYRKFQVGKNVNQNKRVVIITFKILKMKSLYKNPSILSCFVVPRRLIAPSRIHYGDYCWGQRKICHLSWTLVIICIENWTWWYTIKKASHKSLLSISCPWVLFLIKTSHRKNSFQKVQWNTM